MATSIDHVPDHVEGKDSKQAVRPIQTPKTKRRQIAGVERFRFILFYNDNLNTCTIDCLWST